MQVMGMPKSDRTSTSTSTSTSVPIRQPTADAREQSYGCVQFAGREKRRGKAQTVFHSNLFSLLPSF